MHGKATKGAAGREAGTPCKRKGIGKGKEAEESGGGRSGARG